jgi:glycosyltransferase involved in cell wall biosynthesis
LADLYYAYAAKNEHNPLDKQEPYMRHKLSVVLPAYNEEENIKEAVEHVERAVQDMPFSDYEIIVVDDGSADGTGAVLDSMKESMKRLRVIHHGTNKGYGAALRTGFTSATGDLIFYTDSDLQFDVRELKNFLPAIDDYDIVAGFRIYRYDPFNRLVLSWGYNQLMRFLFGIRIRDIDCAFKLFKRNIFDKIKIKTEDFFVDAEIMLKAKRYDFTVTEIGVRHYPRKAGRSTVRPSHIITTLKEIFRIWMSARLGKE